MYKIIEKDNPNHVHSVGYYSKDIAQKRIDSGDAVRYYKDKTLKFIVVEYSK